MIYEAPISKTDQKIQEADDDNGKIGHKQGYLVDLTAVLTNPYVSTQFPIYAYTAP
ncbi:MAG: hypothetical protein IPL33_06585 [Sphingobacteriales bacterium]|nr:hypothetical protein [Sphingobacteriales bacterium]